MVLSVAMKALVGILRSRAYLSRALHCYVSRSEPSLSKEFFLVFPFLVKRSIAELGLVVAMRRKVLQRKDRFTHFSELSPAPQSYARPCSVRLANAKSSFGNCHSMAN